MANTGATLRRGKSKQDYATPLALIEAFEKRFGRLSLDLAAHADNTQCALYLNEADDSLSLDWCGIRHGLQLAGWFWLNPPFGDIAPWARKCAEEQCKIAFLVPASVGANWWRDYVHKKATVYFLNGRVSFDGQNGFPKDCALCLYEQGLSTGYHVWSWKGGTTPRADNATG